MSGTDPDPKPPEPRRASPSDGMTMPMGANLPRIPGITLHFELARGGMGVVYSGRQDFLDRRVAVKLLAAELVGDSFVQRFQREAKLLAGIKHPNIVACHMAGNTDDGLSYLVMEFIDGPSLKKWITDNGPLPAPAALRLTRAVVQALSSAHAVGIIHRDVKAENILLETVTSTAVDLSFPFMPKVVDLGLARASAGSASLGLTSPGSVMGTPATMSPEQFDDPDSVDFRTDIYGLGCVLYEMLVGRAPFRSNKLTEVVSQKRDPIAPNPCVENSDVPAAVGALVQQMLASQRDHRPASYKELDDRLLELIDGLGDPAAIAKTIVKPIVGEETEWGAGPLVRRPSQPPTPPAASKPAPGSTPPGKKPASDSKPPAGQQPPGKPPASNQGPGLLRTAEINFLVEGLDAPPGPPAPPAFSDGTNTGAGSGSKPPGSKIRPVDFDDAPTVPLPSRAAAAASSPVARAATAPAPKRGLPLPMMLAGVVLLVGGGSFALMSWGGGSKSKGGEGNGGTPLVTPPPDDTKPPPPPPPAANRPPQPIQFEESGPVPLGRTVTVTAKTQDPDGDTCQFTWEEPDEIRMLSKGEERSQGTVRIQVLDGLPDVVHELVVKASDGRGGVAVGTCRIRVGDVPDANALTDFNRSRDWTIDEPKKDWSYTMEGFAVCLARTADRQASRALEGQYWEWTGTLQSHELEGTPPANVGVRFEFGDVGWVLACTRASAGEDAAWSIALQRARKRDGKWAIDADFPAIRHEWPMPEEDETRGWFEVQRRGGELRVKIGDALVPGSDNEERPTERKSHRIDLAELPAGVEQRVTLLCDKGRGVFLVRSR